MVYAFTIVYFLLLDSCVDNFCSGLKPTETTKITPKTEIETRIIEEKTIKIDKETMTNRLDLPSNKTM